MTFDDILKDNLTFSKKYSGTGKLHAKKGWVVVTCFDVRLDTILHDALGLYPGDAYFVRTAGGGVTKFDNSVLRSVAFAICLGGCDKILVLGHLDCKMRCSRAELKKSLNENKIKHKAYKNVNENEWFGTFSSEDQNMRHTVDEICECPVIPEGIPVCGAMINFTDGRLTSLVQEVSKASNTELVDNSGEKAKGALGPMSSDFVTSTDLAKYQSGTLCGYKPGDLLAGIGELQGIGEISGGDLYSSEGNSLSSDEGLRGMDEIKGVMDLPEIKINKAAEINIGKIDRRYKDTEIFSGDIDLCEHEIEFDSLKDKQPKTMYNKQDISSDKDTRKSSRYAEPAPPKYAPSKYEPPKYEAPKPKPRPEPRPEYEAPKPKPKPEPRRVETRKPGLQSEIPVARVVKPASKPKPEPPKSKFESPKPEAPGKGKISDLENALRKKLDRLRKNKF